MPVNTIDSFEALILHIQESIYQPVAPFDVTVWSSDEPRTFADRKTGQERAVSLGESWASKLFDCAWMRFSASLPKEIDRSCLVARIDVNGELCLVDGQGTPLRGLTCIKSTFDATLGAPGKTVFRLEPNLIQDGSVELWADAGLNDLFGFLKDNGRLVLAEVALVREDLRQLYYDLETLHDYVSNDEPVEADYQGIQRCIAETSDNLNVADSQSVAEARDLLKPWFASEQKSPLKVHAIGHAHLDLAWLWPIRETVRKGARTFATALYNLERYPHYQFACSQPQLFQWIKESYPTLYKKVKDAVKSGRIEPLGTFWVEPDCSMPSGESFVRQILYGARFFREEFGVVPDFCWQPDVFGYHGQLPQILRRSGHRYFMTQKLSWNVVNRFDHHSFFWEGVDGTRILTHMLPEETYNSPAAARSLHKIGSEYAEREVSNHALMVYGIGDGGGGPDAEHLERLRRVPGLPRLPEVEFGMVSEFFKVWSRDQNQFPTWTGELYLERHQGTLTTQAETKRLNRMAEVALRELEWAAYLSSDWPGGALDELWKEVLLYQFHDVLPGTSIKRVYDECYERYHDILRKLEELIEVRYRKVAQAMMPSAGTVIFNSLSWPRTEWLQSADRWRRVRIPAAGCLGMGAFQVEDAHEDLQASPERLENEHLCVRFDREGYMASVVDKQSGREYLADTSRANDFVIIEDTGNAWDFETNHESKDVWGYLRRRIERPRLTGSKATLNGPFAELRQTWSLRDSTISQTIRLASGSSQVEFDTEVDWQETAAMLRVRFPVAVQAENALYEIPFGHIARSTREDTLVQRAQIEVAALQWVDLSEETHGVALYNDSKHGFRIKQNVIDMALIRSVPYPGAPLINKDDVDESSVGEYTDLGSHRFRYAFRPYEGPCNTARNTAEARMFNTPLRVIRQEKASGAESFADITKGVPMLQHPAIELAAIKRTENGEGWAMRLINVSGEAVTLPPPDGDWIEADLNEQPASGKIPVRALNFRPLEIKTLINS